VKQSSSVIIGKRSIENNTITKKKTYFYHIIHIFITGYIIQSCLALLIIL